jgi:hypothetical protein
MAFVTNKIKQEIKNIEIPSELHKCSKMGILKAKSEMRSGRRKTSKVLPYAATAACLAILMTLGFSYLLNNWSNKSDSQKQANQKTTTQDQNPSKIIQYNPPKDAQETESDDQRQENEQLNALENMTITKSEFSSFKYFLADVDRDKHNDVAHYATDISSCYLYPKYFLPQETDPLVKADEQAVMDQSKKVILSNHAKKDVDDLKALISKLDAKYKNYSADGSYQGLAGDYKKIADLAKNYQLPKSGIVSRSSKPSWYGLDPNEVIYSNGYGFNKKTGQNTEVVVPKGKSLESLKPTKGQYLGVIEGKINGLIDRVEDPKDVTGFQNNIKDIKLKLQEIDEAKKYTGDYPLIQSKLEQVESEFKASEANGNSAKTLKKAIQLYNQAVTDGQELYHAIQVGQGLRNTSN